MSGIYGLYKCLYTRYGGLWGFYSPFLRGAAEDVDAKEVNELGLCFTCSGNKGLYYPGVEEFYSLIP